ncbi:hypothetical protein ACOM2C_00240 [Pseudarthrobacter sp. So.54]
MTRPDPNSPDSSANQDDAVWLDLVARLEESGPAGPATPAPGEDRESAQAPATDTAGTGGPSARPFRDFDPLGLSAGVPIELSAEERIAQRRPEGAGAAASAAPEAPRGPRDYEGAADDPFAPDEFVPEEPPSLAGADPLTVLAWLGAVGAPVALVMCAMFWRAAPLVAILAMVAAFAASVVFLIMQLPGEKDEHDDGARI